MAAQVVAQNQAASAAAAAGASGYTTPTGTHPLSLNDFKSAGKDFANLVQSMEGVLDDNIHGKFRITDSQVSANVAAQSSNPTPAADGKTAAPTSGGEASTAAGDGKGKAPVSAPGTEAAADSPTKPKPAPGTQGGKKDRTMEGAWDQLESIEHKQTKLRKWRPGNQEIGCTVKS